MTALVALSVSDLGVVLEFVGGSAGVVISFVVPSFSYLFLSTRWTGLRIAALITLVFGLLLLPLSIAVEFL